MKTAIICLLLSVAAFASEPDKPAPEISKRVRADLKLMWETVSTAEPGQRASSERATEAAHRVFTTISFRGMTRPELIRLLGDPQKSSRSRYSFPFYPTSKDKLVYRFDTGSYGWQFDFSFDRRGRTSKLTPHGIG